MSLVLHTTRYGLLAFRRNRRARLLTLVFPILLLVIFDGVFHGGHVEVNGVTVDYGAFFVPSVIVFTLTVTSLAMLLNMVVAQRELGILKRRRATPLPSWALVLSQSLTVIAMAISAVVLLVALAGIVFGTTPDASGIPTLVLGVIFGSAAFCGLSYALSTFVDSADSAQPMIQLIMFPLFFISGIWVPTSELPSWLNAVASVFPVEHVADLVHRAYVGVVPVGPILLDVAILAAWAVAGAAVASRRFQWYPSRKG
ncbi:MAG TPA: ABC transporter permease [Solirubrobacterales bacterium]|jgi:ABC-2 type transport system permease protein